MIPRIKLIIVITRIFFLKLPEIVSKDDDGLTLVVNKSVSTDTITEVDSSSVGTESNL